MKIMYKLNIEVTKIDYSVYDNLGISITKNEKSCNGWRDLTIEGTKVSLMYFLKVFMDEGEEYFNGNSIKQI